MFFKSLHALLSSYALGPQASSSQQFSPITIFSSSCFDKSFTKIGNSNFSGPTTGYYLICNCKDIIIIYVSAVSFFVVRTIDEVSSIENCQNCHSLLLWVTTIFGTTLYGISFMSSCTMTSLIFFFQILIWSLQYKITFRNV